MSYNKHKMKALYRTSYSFYKDSQKNPINFVLLSDLHFSSKIKNYVLQSVVEFTQQQKPDYILFLGDIVHSLDELDNEAQITRLKSFFEGLAAVAPVFVSYGNHDYYRYDQYYRGRWRVVSPEKLTNILTSIKNIHVLENNSYEDGKIHLYGFSTDSEYYCYDSAHRPKNNVINPEQEDKNIFIHNLKQIPEKELHKLNKKKINLFLSHSPVFINDKEVKPFISDFDAIVSGHMHNGVVPPALNDVWLSDRGILGPGHNLLPHRTRNASMSYKDPNIILGAIQSVQPSLSPVGILGRAFPIFVATLEVSNNEHFKHCPRKKREYCAVKD